MQMPKSLATWIMGWSTGRNLVRLAASSSGMEQISPSWIDYTYYFRADLCCSG